MITFRTLAPVMVVAALGVVLARKAVHSALLLAVVMISLAITYASQGAPFLFAVQIIVYTGAIMMLFLFVLMLVGVDASDSLVETIKGQRMLALGVGLTFGVLVVLVLARPGGGLPETSLPAEIKLRAGVDWYDFDAKYLEDSVDFDVPALLTPEQTAAVQEVSRRAYLAMDCRGLARVDFFLGTDPDTGADRLVVNEVNTMPGFTPISMYPRMWGASGVDYPELVDRLVASALAG